jgi:hypothetical protein
MAGAFVIAVASEGLASVTGAASEFGGELVESSAAREGIATAKQMPKMRV